MKVEGLFLWKETRSRVGRKFLQLGVRGEEGSNSCNNEKGVDKPSVGALRRKHQQVLEISESGVGGLEEWKRSKSHLSL